jgi:hypothetical protein
LNNVAAVLFRRDHCKVACSVACSTLKQHDHHDAGTGRRSSTKETQKNVALSL